MTSSSRSKATFLIAGTEAARDADALRHGLEQAYERMWQRHCHRRDLALFVGVEPDFKKWLAAHMGK